MSRVGSLQVCFVAPAIYPVLSGDTALTLVGGAEVQQAILARELAHRGHRVSVICMDHGQPDGEVIDGVSVFRSHAPKAGIPGIRFFHPRFSSIWQAMARADADIYYQRSCAAMTGFVSAFSARHGRISIFASASDLDFAPTYPLLRHWRDKKIYHWGVKNASAIVVQTQRQHDECLNQFGLESTRINSCYDYHGRPAEHGGAILWVGSIKPLKRPELFVEVARACPKHRFKMVGGGSHADLASLRRAAAGLDNLAIVGFVPFAQVEQHFDGASLLVNTSVSEGFPNTFLQAWSRGTPSVSFFDPGVQIDGRPLGLVAKSLAEMVVQVQALKADEATWQSHGADCSMHVREKHSVDRAISDYESLFARLMASGVRRAQRS